MALNTAFRVAIGISRISMVSMEIAMNLVDIWLTLWVILIMLLAGFVTPLPYNYWRLKVLGKVCHSIL